MNARAKPRSVTVPAGESRSVHRVRAARRRACRRRRGAARRAGRDPHRRTGVRAVTRGDVHPLGTAAGRAAARGATVIGTASGHNHEFLRSLGAEPTTYGTGLVERVRALAPAGVDAVFDCAGGALPDLIAIAGDPARVVTIADFTAAAHGVHMSHAAPADETGAGLGASADPLAVHGLEIAVTLAGQSRLRVPVAAAFPLAEAAAAHELSESRHARGKIVLIN